MGKKYIIELEDNTAWLQWVNVVDDGQVRFNFKYPEDLTPYTEPDLEQIRKETYQRGLSDAWEAARKIWEYDTTTLREIFGEGIMRMDWFMKFTASEAIEKIWQYEQEKEEQIQVGNEVIYDGKRCVVVFPQTEHLHATIMDCGRFHHTHIVDYDELKKTGRHFPEIAEVLQKMREGQEKKDGVWIANETWIVSEANEPSVDTTLICSKCGYAIKIKPHETPALNFCPKCGDCKKPKEEKS